MTLKGPITVAAGCTDAMHCYISREVHVYCLEILPLKIKVIFSASDAVSAQGLLFLILQ